jgi:hypothetical protein
VRSLRPLRMALLAKGRDFAACVHADYPEKRGGDNDRGAFVERHNDVLAGSRHVPVSSLRNICSWGNYPVRP